ncbi:hypothetical protein AAFF_G00171190 [Aldrovandia affinis]|uniref:Uncharacterized protein n=1 Tax=Aldrovandia affinis TaxID=143900 RepID=A0AAD7W860_9TELE|nr:hypothetical protein AAFF_G00171190 [Aldrovandia affinis]
MRCQEVDLAPHSRLNRLTPGPYQGQDAGEIAERGLSQPSDGYPALERVKRSTPAFTFRALPTITREREHKINLTFQRRENHHVVLFYDENVFSSSHTPALPPIARLRSFPNGKPFPPGCNLQPRNTLMHRESLTQIIIGPTSQEAARALGSKHPAPGGLCLSMWVKLSS